MAEDPENLSSINHIGNYQFLDFATESVIEVAKVAEEVDNDKSS